MNIPEIVARNARLYPNEKALVDTNPGKNIREEITWKEFDERINKVANALIDRGIKQGDKVSQIMYNSTRFLEIFLGILRSGAWAAPLSFRLTSDEIEYCNSISEAKLLFLGEEFEEKIQVVRRRSTSVKDYIFLGKSTPEGMEDYEDFLSSAQSDTVEIEMKDEDGAALYFT